jgi:hypothetical protein
MTTQTRFFMPEQTGRIAHRRRIDARPVPVSAMRRPADPIITFFGATGTAPEWQQDLWDVAGWVVFGVALALGLALAGR